MRRLSAQGSDAGLVAALEPGPATFDPPKDWTASQPLIPITAVLWWGATGPLDAITQASNQ